MTPQSLRAIFDGDATVGGVGSWGGRLVLDRHGETLGEIVQTSPIGDRYLGFSGPTNVLVGLSTDGRVRGLALLDSGDTRDHVDLIEREPRFLTAWTDWLITSDGPLPRPDAVSGATLTGLATTQAVNARLRELRADRVSVDAGDVTGGGDRPASTPDWTDPAVSGGRFLPPPPAETVAAVVPGAIDATAGELPGEWLVTTPESEGLIRVLATSPSADQIIGYQGPTETYLTLDGPANSGETRITGLTIARTFDNEPYVGYVREDWYFSEAFVGKRLDELATLDLKAEGVEGVSGATMTSLAVAEAVIRAARAVGNEGTVTEDLPAPVEPPDVGSDGLATGASPREARTESIWTGHTITQGAIVAWVILGLLIAWGRLPAKSPWRVGFQLLLIGGLGLTAGALLSMAQLVGWTRSGLPWMTAFGLVALTVVALGVPALWGRNVYCDHLCPHGAAQQLLRRTSVWRPKLPAGLVRGLVVIRPVLLLFVVIWAMVPAVEMSGVSLADIEPFDAWSLRAILTPTAVIALISLAASWFVPMAYCRYGCPTGLLLDILRRHGRSGELAWTDGMLVVLLVVAVGVFLVF